jgi:pimeloyl-ACP methyl ester carboxylesterase
MMTTVILLPGIVTPAALRYRGLQRALGGSVRTIVKELEVYADPEPPEDYSIDSEVAGISRVADAVGVERFHLYGFSAGGACALAYLAAHPGRVLTLAVDEPATDFSPEDKALVAQEAANVARLPEADRLRAFLQMQVAPGVQVPAPPPGLQPTWIAKRPSGIAAFTTAIQRYTLPEASLSSFNGPVYYSYGRLSNLRWLAMRDRLMRTFRRLTIEEYETAHHLNTSHESHPDRVAAALLRLWES